MTNTKLYKINLVKSYYKVIDLLFICTGINLNYYNLRMFKKKINGFYFLTVSKINIKILKINLKKSISNFITKYFSSSIFFLKNNSILFLLNKKKLFKKNFVYILGIKLNNKLYSFNNLRKLFCLNYYQTKKALFQFLLLYVKKATFSK